MESRYDSGTVPLTWEDSCKSGSDPDFQLAVIFASFTTLAQVSYSRLM
jgi:hypothetical protein